MNTKLVVSPIQALKDNYIWLLTKPKMPDCVVVDPGDAKPVLEVLSSKSHIPATLHVIP